MDVRILPHPFFLLLIYLLGALSQAFLFCKCLVKEVQALKCRLFGAIKAKQSFTLEMFIFIYKIFQSLFISTTWNICMYPRLKAHLQEPAL
ncbi:hypothetical protein CLU79DRAFT_376832 [Phycomyces nitens]|nr:hypothetical protein CLU79DRAFT_376832 [Phycomyces nitens]